MSGREGDGGPGYPKFSLYGGGHPKINIEKQLRVRRGGASNQVVSTELGSGIHKSLHAALPKSTYTRYPHKMITRSSGLSNWAMLSPFQCVLRTHQMLTACSSGLSIKPTLSRFQCVAETYRVH